MLTTPDSPGIKVDGQGWGHLDPDVPFGEIHYMPFDPYRFDPRGD